MAFTKITNTVITANTIISSVIGSNVILERHIANAQIFTRHINSTLLNISPANDYATYLSALANDFGTYTNAISTSNSNFKANDYATYQAIINVPSLSFGGDIVIPGNLFVQGDTFQANVGNLVVEDKTIVVNQFGTDALAEGAGLQIAGTSNLLIGNLTFAAASPSKFRAGLGTLTADHDLFRRTEALANDYNTYVSLNANINVVQSNLNSALANQNLVAFVNTNTSTSTSNVYFIGSPVAPPNANTISFYVDGANQPTGEWIFNSGNNTVQLKDPSVPAGLTIFMQAWYKPA